MVPAWFRMKALVWPSINIKDNMGEGVFKTVFAEDPTPRPPTHPIRNGDSLFAAQTVLNTPLCFCSIAHPLFLVRYIPSCNDF